MATVGIIPEEALERHGYPVYDGLNNGPDLINKALKIGYKEGIMEPCNHARFNPGKGLH